MDVKTGVPWAGPSERPHVPLSQLGSPAARSSRSRVAASAHRRHRRRLRTHRKHRLHQAVSLHPGSGSTGTKEILGEGDRDSDEA